MKEILEKRIRNKSLSKDEAKHTLLEIGQGKCNSHQIAAFLTTYMMRLVTVEELSGFRAALLDLCIAIDLKDYDPIDLCGTGGDGKDTFNISTLASFVTAGAGVAFIQDYTAGLDKIQGVAGGGFTLTDQGLAYGVGSDQMLMLLGINDASQVTVI